MDSFAGYVSVPRMRFGVTYIGLLPGRVSVFRKWVAGVDVQFWDCLSDISWLIAMLAERCIYPSHAAGVVSAVCCLNAECLIDQDCSPYVGQM